MESTHISSCSFASAESPMSEMSLASPGSTCTCNRCVWFVGSERRKWTKSKFQWVAPWVLRALSGTKAVSLRTYGLSVHSEAAKQSKAVLDRCQLEWNPLSNCHKINVFPLFLPWQLCHNKLLGEAVTKYYMKTLVVPGWIVLSGYRY